MRVPGALYWDTLRLWHEIQHGIAVATRERKLTLDGIGIDTWGVDYGLLGADGLLIDSPRHYRDARTNGVMEKLFEVVPRDQVFGYTGIQFMQLNTLYQLYAMRLGGSPALGVAARAAQYSGPVQLLAYRRGEIRNHHRQHHAVLQSRIHDVGHGVAPAAEDLPTEMLCRNRPAGHAARQHARAAARTGLRDGGPRYRGGGGRRTRGERRQLVLHQFGNLVADGSRTRPAGDQRAIARRQLHQ